MSKHLIKLINITRPDLIKGRATGEATTTSTFGSCAKSMHSDSCQLTPSKAHQKFH